MCELSLTNRGGFLIDFLGRHTFVPIRVFFFCATSLSLYRQTQEQDSMPASEPGDDALKFVVRTVCAVCSPNEIM